MHVLLQNGHTGDDVTPQASFGPHIDPEAGRNDALTALIPVDPHPPSVRVIGMQKHTYPEHCVNIFPSLFWHVSARPPPSTVSRKIVFFLKVTKQSEPPTTHQS